MSDSFFVGIVLNLGYKMNEKRFVLFELCFYLI